LKIPITKRVLIRKTGERRKKGGRKEKKKWQSSKRGRQGRVFQPKKVLGGLRKATEGKLEGTEEPGDKRSANTTYGGKMRNRGRFTGRKKK